MKLCLSRSSIASRRICSKNFSYWVLAKIKLHLIEFNPRFVQNALYLKFNYFLCFILFYSIRFCMFGGILLKRISNLAKLCLSRNSIASYRETSRTTPICVSAKIHLNLLEKFLRHFQKVLQPNLKCIWLKLFQDRSKLCHSWKSIATHRKYPKTIRNCNWADFQLHLIEQVLRISQIASKPNFKCIWLKLIQDLTQMLQSWNSITFYRSTSEIFPILCEIKYICIFMKNPQTFPNCVLAEIQLHIIDNTLGEFPNVSWPKLKSILSTVFWDNSNLCLSRNSIASSWKFIWCSQTVSSTKIVCIWSKLFQVMSKLLFNRNSMPSYRIDSQILSNCLLAEIQSHLFEKVT